MDIYIRIRKRGITLKPFGMASHNLCHTHPHIIGISWGIIMLLLKMYKVKDKKRFHSLQQVGNFYNFTSLAVVIKLGVYHLHISHFYIF